MPSIIDSLILSIGLDPSKFVAGAKEVDAATKRTRENVEKYGKDVEDRGHKTTQSLQRLQGQVLLLFSAFTAGRGIKDFITNIVQTDAGLGRLAYTLDTTVQKLTTWTGAGAMVGASSNEILSSFQSLTSQFEQFRMTGQASVVPYFRALGVNMADANGRMRDMGDVLWDLHGKFVAMKDPAQASWIGQQMGLSQGMVNLLLQSDDALKKYLETAKKYQPTPQDIEAYTKLQMSWNELGMASTKMGTTLLTQLAPALQAISNLLLKMADWLIAHPKALEALGISLAIVAGVIAVSAAGAVAGIGAIGAAFIALGTAIGVVIAYWQDVKNFFHQLQNGFGTFWSGIFGKTPPPPRAGGRPASPGFEGAVDQVLHHEDPGLTGRITRDSGGVTKYGISKRAHPEIDVEHLTIDQARQVYRDKYWNAIGGDKLAANIQADALDAAVNQGVGNTLKWLKQSGGDVAKFNALRREQYQYLARVNPEKYGRYLQGWLNRLNDFGAPQIAANISAGRMHHIVNQGGNTSSSQTDVTIHNVNVNAPQAKGGKEIATEFGKELKRRSFAMNANFSEV